MNPVHSVKNQFLGVNPHLHSYLQANRLWTQFHMRYLVHLSDTLSSRLRPIRYVAQLTSSLQIRRVDDGEISDPESDVTIYDLDPVRPIISQFSPPPLMSAGVGERVLSIPKNILRNRISDKPYQAVSIYEVQPDERRSGDPVVWIELLSPSNKSGHSDHRQYLEKRFKLIQSGIVFVEIDFLHETLPTILEAAIYRGDKLNPWLDDAHPYRIIIVEPRPDVERGSLRLYEFDVDQPIPTMTIPLNAGDTLDFDFGIPYRRTYESAELGLEAYMDYRQLPLHFERYSPFDQTRIARRMASIVQAAQAGIDVETTTFAVEELSLIEALKQLELLK